MTRKKDERKRERDNEIFYIEKEKEQGKHRIITAGK